eukprot:TRINITY_DN48517_c0_g1_i1.p1 TRINITY_DN48517_c0_g1~~TRINITY_DN48517_c0_g1_i1.p1  ORF type:complete len:157 (-),score=23.56 TRINITY_DN48517_c0_g1_i1:83-499(-)
MQLVQPAMPVNAVPSAPRLTCKQAPQDPPELQLPPSAWVPEAPRLKPSPSPDVSIPDLDMPPAEQGNAELLCCSGSGSVSGTGGNDSGISLKSMHEPSQIFEKLQDLPCLLALLEARRRNGQCCSVYRKLGLTVRAAC